MSNPFRYFNSSPEVIRLVVMMYVRFPLSLRNVEDLLAERGIDISHKTVRFWWNRFGPMFAAEIRIDPGPFLATYAGFHSARRCCPGRHWNVFRRDGRAAHAPWGCGYCAIALGRGRLLSPSTSRHVAGGPSAPPAAVYWGRCLSDDGAGIVHDSAS